MTKKIKVTTIKKVRNQPCGRCNIKAKGNPKVRKDCIRCNGTGNIKDYHYIMIVGNMAIDMDTVK
jgi:DnaJ-class molecular chaperone